MAIKLAVISGKGGTGKTFIATNLAYVLSTDYKVQLLDCDVEEPNDHLFLPGKKEKAEEVVKFVPVVDHTKCKHTGNCSAECQFGAIVTYPTVTMVLRKLCHGCGLCSTLCPEGAITEIPEKTGVINHYRIRENFVLSEGVLNIGEPSGVRVIRQLKKNVIPGMDFYIYDSPPGSSCPVVETLRGVDYAILVTESSPFGLHDLKLVLEIVNEMEIPHAVIINRYDEDFTDMEEFLIKKREKILLKIPFDARISKVYSEGKLFAKMDSEFYDLMKNLIENLESKIYETDSCC